LKLEKERLHMTNEKMKKGKIELAVDIEAKEIYQNK
jgi:hypothetical protein